MCNIINIRKIMKDNTTLNISPKAVNEYSLRIIEHIEDYTPQLAEIAKKHKRKTIFDLDVIELFGYVDKTISGEEA